jgi:hypothetical protein
MPDAYMNLTKTEAAELGYGDRGRRSRGQARRRVEPALRELLDEEFPAMLGGVFGTAAVFVILFLLLHAFTSSSSHQPQVEAKTTQTTSTVQRKHKPAQSALPRGNKNTPQEYLPAGWEYASTDSPINVHDSEQRVIAVVSAGTEFLRSCQTTKGWAFVATLDGAAWGWARLNPVVPRQIHMNPKFEKALVHTRGVEVLQKDEDPVVYLPAGWEYASTDSPINVHDSEQRVIAVVSAGTEFLRSCQTTKGWAFVATLDGAAWGWARLNPVVPRQIHMNPKFEKALVHTRGVEVLQKDEDPVVYLPAGWEYRSTSGPLTLRQGYQANATIQAGTEFLCYLPAREAWSFVATLDGETWGWARLNPLVPRQILMDPKFEKALARFRSLQRRRFP